jgi:hypothetical protein
MSYTTFPAGTIPRSGSATDSFWRDTLAAFAASGQSVASFCQERGLKQATFYSRRLRQDQIEQQRTSPTAARPRSTQPAFVPVVVEHRGMVEESFQVDLRGGRVLRLPASIPAARLAEVVHALEGQL